jgi:hypothetical protein
MVFYDPAAADCDLDAGNRADENGDILVGPDCLFTNLVYSFTHELTWSQWKGIRDNMTKSIEVRYYANDGNQYSAIVFIKSIKYRINDSVADYTCWVKTLTEI